jgi:hypothetical protein
MIQIQQIYYNEKYVVQIILLLLLNIKIAEDRLFSMILTIAVENALPSRCGYSLHLKFNLN